MKYSEYYYYGTLHQAFVLKKPIQSDIVQTILRFLSNKNANSDAIRIPNPMRFRSLESSYSTKAPSPKMQTSKQVLTSSSGLAQENPKLSIRHQEFLNATGKLHVDCMITKERFRPKFTRKIGWGPVHPPKIVRITFN